MNKHIGEYLAWLMPELAREGIEIQDQKEIDYGWQLHLQDKEHKSVLNLYYSEKKGVSKVLAGKETPLKARLRLLLARNSEQTETAFHTWERWIGSDEAGKGDYFGPLVVAAFAMDQEMEEELRSLGVMDSKRLTDQSIKSIAHSLYERFPEQISCVVIKPLRYNEIIADMQSRTENLNDLLAWQHGKAIMELLQRIPNIHGILVDRFSHGKKVSKLLSGKEIPVPVEERVKAEADPAVAAASIIARYQFLQAKASMAKHFGMKFPLGSGKNVLEPARTFADKFGWERLAEVAKLHFVTSREVRARDIFEPSADK
ncbi:MAG: ribonuclease HIII [Candidatus Cloacimonetes bacterium]|nr:ribonuclease HIII [Candidatus Cloacimonadota bacterium]